MKQIKEYYICKNAPIALKKTTDLLRQLKENNFYISATDSLRTYKQLYTYILEQEVKWEYLHFMKFPNDSIKKEEARLWAYRPLPIIQLEACRSACNDQMLDIVCKRKKTGLPAHITELLLRSYSLLLQEEYKHKYEVVPSDDTYRRWEEENKYICQLVPQQFLDKYFKIIICDNVKKQVQKDWKTLQEYNLVKSADSVRIVNKLLDYEMRLSIADKWVSVNNSRKNQFTRSDIENGKPQLLKQLYNEKEKRKNETIVKF